ncbi:hypothetical protein OG21DRAFT_1060322 [Imleria badia]|nr:hypothetical protein OG21DRAFT_1060322 [Imleria badia]
MLDKSMNGSDEDMGKRTCRYHRPIVQQHFKKKEKKIRLRAENTDRLPGHVGIGNTAPAAGRRFRGAGTRAHLPSAASRFRAALGGLGDGQNPIRVTATGEFSVELIRPIGRGFGLCLLALRLTTGRIRLRFSMVSAETMARLDHGTDCFASRSCQTTYSHFHSRSSYRHHDPWCDRPFPPVRTSSLALLLFFGPFREAELSSVLGAYTLLANDSVCVAQYRFWWVVSWFCFQWSTASGRSSSQPPAGVVSHVAAPIGSSQAPGAIESCSLSSPSSSMALIPIPWNSSSVDSGEWMWSPSGLSLSVVPSRNQGWKWRRQWSPS